MKQFIKYVFASAIGFFLSAAFILFLGVLIIIGSIAGLQSEFSKKWSAQRTATIDSNAVILMELDYPILDRGPEKPFDFDFNRMEPTVELGLNDILANLKKAKADAKVRGIYLKLDNFGSSFAITEELRQGLLDFRESGKFVVAYGDHIGRSAYYLATAADAIHMNPTGFIFFNGLNMELAFLRGTFDKLEIKPMVFRSGKYKSAIEPYTQQAMSPENREQLTVLLHGIYQDMLTGISAHRNISTLMLDSMASQLLVRNPHDAVEYGLLDGTAYKDNLLADIRKRIQLDETEAINFVKLKKYHRVQTKAQETADEQIALIYASGAIVEGRGGTHEIGSDRLSASIRKARKDSAVKAIVLRINSPGGSATASEVIWREVILATEAKPVIVSMSSLAASGGYYIACAADKIYAYPATITGSIGVFGLLFNTKDFFNKKLGVTFDRVKTSPFADIGNPNRTITEEERQVIQGQIDNIYDIFVERVSEGRDQSYHEVHKIAQGRVWTGRDAKAIGLVDELGGIEEAMAAAAEMAGLEDYEVVELPKRKDPFQKLLSQFASDIRAGWLQFRLGDRYYDLDKMRQALSQQGVQARLPYQIEIR